MKKSYLALLVSVIFILATVGSSFAAMGEGTVSAKKGVDITLFGSNLLIPSYYENLTDFNDDSRDNTLLEGGWSSGFFVRNELRLGFKGAGENWGFKVILENDIIMNKANGDRNDYGNGDDPFGSEFGVERSNFWYDFGPVKLSAGWDIKFCDIKTGGLVYGDDHPFISLTGGDKTLSWEATMLIINELADLDGSAWDDEEDGDWYAYYGKLNYTFAAGEGNKFTISPFMAFSDMGEAASKSKVDCEAYYFGFEGYGNFGIIQPAFEVAYVCGEVGDDVDIDAWAGMVGVTVAVSPAFNPYFSLTYQSGDDDPTDDDAEGFVGITNIARHARYGMYHSILGEHFTAIGSPLYAISTERWSGGNKYGGIGGGGSGNNPGLIYANLGAKGKIEKVTYKAQAGYLWVAEDDTTGDDNEIGWILEGQVGYPISKNFSVLATASYFEPEDAAEFRNGSDDAAYLANVQIAWKW